MSTYRHSEILHQAPICTSRNLRICRNLTCGAQNCLNRLGHYLRRLSSHELLKNSILLGLVSKSKESICFWQSLSSSFSLHKYFKNINVKYGFLILSVLKLMQPIVFCTAAPDCTEQQLFSKSFFFFSEMIPERVARCIVMWDWGHFTQSTTNSQDNFHTCIIH